MSDFYWTITPNTTRDGYAYQARALKRIPGYPGIIDTRALGLFHLIRASDDDDARRVVEAPPLPTPPAPEDEAEDEPEDVPASQPKTKPPARRASPRRRR